MNLQQSRKDDVLQGFEGGGRIQQVPCRIILFIKVNICMELPVKEIFQKTGE